MFTRPQRCQVAMVVLDLAATPSPLFSGGVAVYRLINSMSVRTIAPDPPTSAHGFCLSK
jgi:hypothetical protein